MNALLFLPRDALHARAVYDVVIQSICLPVAFVKRMNISLNFSHRLIAPFFGFYAKRNCNEITVSGVLCNGGI